ncbi:hypothetical protein [Limosilactobacillus sp.]|uniref:hypothetical protein n=1 Tax=Limosilactobacillus sp. TaxID=2773925 RepID=UPI0025B8926C|nr:hypothetical protein [Limosilactobacillus sp.]MCH3921319.1 hypothetical protein [Limosilactobacillus sp.]MCH3928090.1 hypothetical protein [Limosilactobacillus sp.]
MAEEKNDSQTKELLVNTKEALAKAEKELIHAKKDKHLSQDENLMKIITTNYEVAKNNVKMAKQLAGDNKPSAAAAPEPTPKSSTISTAPHSEQSVVRGNKLIFTTPQSAPAAASTTAATSTTVTFPEESMSTASTANAAQATSTTAANAANAGSADVTMTRHQYREKMKHNK